uniref:Uncharacterized protein n=1 Tax=Pipistrellus kuhlii TaxID=59472 RepID=A0A7J7RM31_PIPKU|nr:hypothetical protein mPipKuh1_010407 [Pipistrellus kuhlii]
MRPETGPPAPHPTPRLGSPSSRSPGGQSTPPAPFLRRLWERGRPSPLARSPLSPPPRLGKRCPGHLGTHLHPGLPPGGRSPHSAQAASPLPACLPAPQGSLPLEPQGGVAPSTHKDGPRPLWPSYKTSLCGQ